MKKQITHSTATAIIAYRDQPTSPFEATIALQLDVRSDDEDIFYYCQDEAELRGMMQSPNPCDDFVVLSYDLD